MNKEDFAKFLYTKLREEVLQTQELRARMIYYKITFISSFTGALWAVYSLTSQPQIREIIRFVWALPPFAAICFDFLISGYSFSIKRIGFFFRTYIEPILRPAEWPKDFPMWEQFMADPAVRQRYSIWGHLGLTGIISLASGVMFCSDGLSLLKAIILAIILVSFFFDVKSFLQVGRIASFGFKK